MQKNVIVPTESAQVPKKIHMETAFEQGKRNWFKPENDHEINIENDHEINMVLRIRIEAVSCSQCNE